MENITLSNLQFNFLDIWYEQLSDQERLVVDSNYTSQLDYLGLQLLSEQNERFNFVVIDQQKWNTAKNTHTFFQ
jgi:hypothetical protein